MKDDVLPELVYEYTDLLAPVLSTFHIVAAGDGSQQEYTLFAGSSDEMSSADYTNIEPIAWAKAPSFHGAATKAAIDRLIARGERWIAEQVREETT